MVALFHSITVDCLCLTVICFDPVFDLTLESALLVYVITYFPIGRLIGKDTIPLLFVVLVYFFPLTFRVIFLLANGIFPEVN